LVDALTVPKEILTRTTEIYRYIFWRPVGKKLETFQREEMGIDVNPKPVHIEVVVGSESDLVQMRSGLSYLHDCQHMSQAMVKLHVISCHRNPSDLIQYAANITPGTIIIAGADCAAQLPGMLKALLHQYGNGETPVIGVGFNGTREQTEAARLSIKCLPGQLVLMDGQEPYMGPEGFYAAARAAVEHEFLRVPPENMMKLAQMNLPLVPSST
jgi:phosphoribosylcarboxyaminoimidazole (NCAIR) mutase